MYDLNLEFPAFLLSLFCFVYCITAKHRQYIPPKSLKNKFNSQHYVYLIMLVTSMISAISSVVGVFLTNVDFYGVEVWQYIFHAIYFFFHTTLSVSFAVYIINVTGTNNIWKKKHYILFLIPYVAAEILVLTNSFTNLCFYMDSKIYHRGPLMPLLYAIGGLYVVLGLIIFLKYQKAISRTDRIAVATFIILASVGIIIQAIFSKLLVELFSEALACLVLMIVLEEKSGHIDITTGIYNRLAFVDMNRKLIASKQNYNIFIFRIIDFEKLVNKIGVREVESLSMKIASYFSKEADVLDVYLVKRDSFAVIFTDKTYEVSLDFANKIAYRFNDYWQLGSLKIKLDILYAVIRIPQDVVNIEELEYLIAAEYKMNKPGTQLIPPKEIDHIISQRLYEDELHKAIEGKQLTIYYQPIWSVKEKKTTSAEALLRITSDVLSHISPEEYIPIAERTGLIRDIGLFVFEGVCKFLSSEEVKNSNIEYVELNLSIFQFMYDDLVSKFEEIRKEYNVEPSKINLEITETTASIEEEVVTKMLNDFSRLGYTLSLDDFGTGYSNIVRIMDSDYLNIKIDKSILWNVKDYKNPSSLINTMSFIKNMSFNIIQEGVETKEQLDLAIKCGADYIQGFYFSKPINEEAFISYLDKEERFKS